MPLNHRDPASILALQRQVGNRAVGAVLARCGKGACGCGGCDTDEELLEDR